MEYKSKTYIHLIVSNEFLNELFYLFYWIRVVLDCECVSLCVRAKYMLQISYKEENHVVSLLSLLSFSFFTNV